ncbi:MAG: 2-phosphoglycolate phosphatase [Oleiphilaceae bacterium]|jgi:2-phosphoglycolate phosphatase
MNKHQNKIDALLFDLDGTLVDTAADFIEVLNAQRTRHNFESLSEQAIRNTVSNGARALTQLAFGGREGEELFEQYRAELLENYMQVVGIHAKLFDGMSEILLICEEKEIPWGIITNKPRKFTEKLMIKLELSSRCSILLCADDVTQPKPHPESMFIAANKLNIDLKRSVYVGDHDRDIAAGNAASMITVAAEYGYINSNSKLTDWNASHIIQHPSQLKQLFLA